MRLDGKWPPKFYFRAKIKDIEIVRPTQRVNNGMKWNGCGLAGKHGKLAALV